jgi:hypothetical protein
VSSSDHVYLGLSGTDYCAREGDVTRSGASDNDSACDIVDAKASEDGKAPEPIKNDSGHPNNEQRRSAILSTLHGLDTGHEHGRDRKPSGHPSHSLVRWYNARDDHEDFRVRLSARKAETSNEYSGQEESITDENAVVAADDGWSTMRLGNAEGGDTDDEER